MLTVRNPILWDYVAALRQSRVHTGRVSRRVAREARIEAYRRLVERHGGKAVTRHQPWVKAVLDDAAHAVERGGEL